MIESSENSKVGCALPTRGRLRRKATVNERLLNAILSISRCATLEEALAPLLDAALDLTKMDGGGVYWVEGDTAVIRHYRGLPEAFIQEVRRMSLNPLPVQVLLQQQEPLELAEISPVMRQLFRRHGIRQAFSFPLRAGEIVFGFLNVAATGAEEPERSDILALHILVKEMESLFLRFYGETVLRESEERYRMLTQSVLDGIVLHEMLSGSQRGRFIDANEHACRMLGYTRAEMLQLSPLDVTAAEEQSAIPRLMHEAGQSGKVLFEIVLVRKDGRRIPVEIKANVIQFEGRPVALSVIRDITKRKQMEEQLRRVNEQLEERVRARTDELRDTIDRLQRLTLELSQAEERERKRLADSLHDDLQQTLAGAKFHLDLLDRQLGSDQAARETLEQAQQMLKEAIEKSRNLSHELGPPVLYRDRLDTMFEWLASQMEKRHGLTVRVEICGSLDCRSEPVRSFLYRTAQEILFNIVKHAEVREARLRLQRVRNELWLTIIDRGRGFEPASLVEMTGFGLLTIRERARLIGGRMKIKSAPAKGSIFFITAPDLGA